MRRLDVSVRAKREIDDILLTSEERHGPRTAQRYRELFAFDELVADPLRPSTRPSGRRGVRLHLLRSTAKRLGPAGGVRSPPHLIAFIFDDTQLTIIRVLHDAMDLPQRLAAYR